MVVALAEAMAWVSGKTLPLGTLVLPFATKKKGVELPVARTAGLVVVAMVVSGPMLMVPEVEPPPVEPDVLPEVEPDVLPAVEPDVAPEVPPVDPPLRLAVPPPPDEQAANINSP